jgi:hypothetical protein
MHGLLTWDAPWEKLNAWAGWAEVDSNQAFGRIVRPGGTHVSPQPGNGSMTSKAAGKKRTALPRASDRTKSFGTLELPAAAGLASPVPGKEGQGEGGSFVYQPPMGPRAPGSLSHSQGFGMNGFLGYFFFDSSRCTAGSLHRDLYSFRSSLNRLT